MLSTFGIEADFPKPTGLTIVVVDSAVARLEITRRQLEVFWGMDPLDKIRPIYNTFPTLSLYLQLLNSPADGQIYVIYTALHKFLHTFITFNRSLCILNCTNLYLLDISYSDYYKFLNSYLKNFFFLWNFDDKYFQVRSLLKFY